MNYKKRRRLRKEVKIFILIIILIIIFILIKNNKVDDSAEQEFKPQNTTSSDVAVTEIVKSEKNDTDWQLMLVNKNNPIPLDYELEVIDLSNGQQVDARIYPDLQEMFNAARNDGILIEVTSGYRGSDKQKEIMQSYIDTYTEQGLSQEDAMIEAEKYVLQPGTSEHELGLAVDINTSDSDIQDSESTWQWLRNNAYLYGFILRYPENKTAITGIDYEPWHYRYVGKKAAFAMQESGQCLEEYLTDK